MMKMKHVFLSIMLLVSFALSARNYFSINAGTDIPYQYYAGMAWESEHIGLSYRTGVLTFPYSDIIMNLIGALGVDEVYVNLLDNTYKFGWMNTLSAYYKFGGEKSWYAGLDFRLDYLSAADTTAGLVETITGISIPEGRIGSITANLGVMLYGIGIRFGHVFPFGKDKRHGIRLELSFSKYFASQSSLKINGYSADRINERLNTRLWDDVFQKYGFVGGIGISYSYRWPMKGNP
ncbi:MAG: hypothetical protein B0D92_06525 [Spirochaeta sp. LUC14_002_19_P3]|nr:MAG: hypothetical protein B0D92_06525 [Spirochaeta sp. LUC14_002_19_P3]